MTTIRLITLLLLLAYGAQAKALSLGVSIGSASLESSGQSNIEKAYSGTETSTSSPGWSFSLLAHHGFSDYLFGEVGLSELSYLEKVQKNNNYNADGARAFKITTKESISAAHTALGLAVFLGRQFAVFAKLGVSLNENTFSVKQVVNHGDTQVQSVNDSKTSTDYQLRLYGGLGGFYNISDNLSLKVEYEEFGVLGDGATVDTFYIPDTVDNPEAAGVYIKRVMVGLLFRVF